MHPICKKVGKRVRTLRKDRGWSQATLAEKAALHPTYIGGIERGERNLSLVNLDKLARAFGVSLADLLRLPDLDKDRISSNATGSLADFSRVLHSIDQIRERVGARDLGKDGNPHLLAALSFFLSVCMNCEKLDLYRKLTSSLLLHEKDSFSSPSAE